MTLPKDFWDRVETDDLKYVIYGDTDSLYLSIPEIQPKDTEEAVKLGDEVSEEINDIIIDYMNKNILPKMNCEGHNETFFKTELIMDAILFTNVKKKYCFREIAKEGTIHETPKIEYTGISVVRTNTASWTKGFIKEIVEDLALNTQIQGKENVRKKMNEIATKYHEQLKQAIEDLNFTDIGVPCKWSGTKYKRDTAELVGMKLYNTITQQEYFQEATSGLKIPIKIKKPNEFLEKVKNIKKQSKFYIGDTTIDRLSFLVVPIYHVKEELAPVLKQFGIIIDLDTAWDKLVETTLTRIIDCVKENHGLSK